MEWTYMEDKKPTEMYKYLITTIHGLTLTAYYIPFDDEWEFMDASDRTYSEPGSYVVAWIKWPEPAPWRAPKENK